MISVAIATNVIDASNWDRSRAGNLDESVDQNELDTTTVSVSSDPSNTLTEASNDGNDDDDDDIVDMDVAVSCRSGIAERTT